MLYVSGRLSVSSSLGDVTSPHPAGLAQLVEHLICNHEVASSILAPGSSQMPTPPHAGQVSPAADRMWALPGEVNPGYGGRGCPQMPRGGDVNATIRSAFGLLAVLTLVTSACGSDDDSSTVEESAGSGTEVTVASGDDEFDLSAYGTDRPEGVVGGAVFDAMTFLTYPEEMAVCTSETLLSSTTEEQLLADGIEVIEEAAVDAALACGADEEAMDSLRFKLQDSELNSDES